LCDIYFTYYIRSKADVCRPSGDELQNVDLFAGQTQEKGTTARAVLVQGWGMVISQDCEIPDHRRSQPNILVARLWRIESVIAEYEKQKGETQRVKWLRKNLLNLGPYTDFFYLQAREGVGLPVSVADLGDVHAFSKKSDAAGLLTKRVLSLTPDAKKYLQARLAHFFGRLAVDETHFLTPAENAAIQNE